MLSGVLFACECLCSLGSHGFLMGFSWVSHGFLMGKLRAVSCGFARLSGLTARSSAGIVSGCVSVLAF